MTLKNDDFFECEVIFMKKIDLVNQAEKIMEMARETGVQSNFFFITTFERYQMQLHILDGLQKTIEEKGVQVTKEYVKGKKNVYSNPAIQDYNKTTDSANKTVSTLLKIIKNFNFVESDEEEDPLLKIINGDDADG